LDPILFSFNLFGRTIELHWYGLLVALGVAVAAWLAEREVRRRGENPDHVWNALLWLLPAGILGARLWYVANTTLGGNSVYLENPGRIIAVWEGGLHFFGGLLFGAIALFFYARHYKLDMWLFLDSVAPVTMIGQAIARPANFINQELYGTPTTLPWGILIDRPLQRIGEFRDLAAYPLETTRFHPIFAYEMIWNFTTAGFLLWAGRRWPEKFKPATMFACWLIAAGIGRTLVEFLRHDQPLIPGTMVSYSQLVSALMALTGLVLYLVRLGKLNIPRLKFPDSYTIAPPLSPSAKRTKKAARRKQRNGK
jgi:phosphatidylglycerol---prolipoprotein diacylglyceryl transferase